jgi:hypothetical protein
MDLPSSEPVGLPVLEQDDFTAAEKASLVSAVRFHKIFILFTLSA